jgi:hypothetical protein
MIWVIESIVKQSTNAQVQHNISNTFQFTEHGTQTFLTDFYLIYFWFCITLNYPIESQLHISCTSLDKR